MAANRKPPIKTLRELRVDAGLSLPELAEAAGVSKGTLSSIELGRIVARTSELERLGTVLDVDLENRMQVVATPDEATS